MALDSENVSTAISSTDRKTTSADTRRALVRAALQLFVKKGYHRTTTNDIITTAGVATGTLYVHFKSKEELALELLHHCSESSVEGLSEALAEVKTTSERLRVLIGHVFDWCERHKEEATYLMLLRHADFLSEFPSAVELAATHRDIRDRRHDSLNAGAAERVNFWRFPQDFLDRIIEQGVEQGEIPPGPMKVLRAVAGILVVLLRERLQGWSDTDLRDEVEATTAVYCSALGISYQSCRDGNRSCLPKALNKTSGFSDNA